MYECVPQTYSLEEGKRVWKGSRVKESKREGKGESRKRERERERERENPDNVTIECSGSFSLLMHVDKHDSHFFLFVCC